MVIEGLLCHSGFVDDPVDSDRAQAVVGEQLVGGVEDPVACGEGAPGGWWALVHGIEQMVDRPVCIVKETDLYAYLEFLVGDKRRGHGRRSVLRLVQLRRSSD